MQSHVFNLSLSKENDVFLCIDPPNFTQHPNDHQIKVIGEDVKFSCTVTGYPVPDIYWMKDGKLLTSANNDSMKYTFIIQESNNSDRTASLYISDLIKDDIGYYSCYSNNSLVADLEESSTTGYLNVLCKFILIQF